ncbi:MAG: hypothetical protein BWY82_01292 [Verrucomicrobia bacterium ADurb.Bin474]|nr:MAG: hypothetical protein BWY82_01292 [Verrucomicrobia bacterium ADurb.Bin474]
MAMSGIMICWSSLVSSIKVISWRYFFDSPYCLAVTLSASMSQSQRFFSLPSGLYAIKRKR